MAKTKNFLILHNIQSDLHKSLFLVIAVVKSAKDAGNALKDAYQGSDQVNVVKLQTLKKEFENLRMQEQKSVIENYVKSQRCD